MSQDSELSIVEYARHYELAHDHRAAHPLESLPPHDESLYLASIESSPNEPTASLITSTLEDELSAERMFIDEPTARLLGSITQPARTPPRFDEDIELRTMYSKKLKLALPLLHTDHECDLREVFQRPEPNLRNEFLPFESLDEDADEGFSWPSKYLNLPNEIWKNLTAEKLEIPAKALQYLSEIVKYNKLDDCNATFEIDKQEQLTYKKRVLPQPVTPPVLPMSPEHVPFVSPSEIGYLDPLSEHSSPTKEQLRMIEEQIFAHDAVKISRKPSGSSPESSDPMLLDSDSIGEIFTPLKGIRDMPSSPPDDRLPPQKLKVDVPLIVAEAERQFRSQQKGVPFCETLTEIIPSLPAPLPDFQEDDIINDINAFFDEEIQTIAVEAERSIEQEQLQEADTTRRVSIPIMDFSLPRAPWSITHSQTQSSTVHIKRDQLLQDIGALHFKDHAWVPSGKLERELQWTPLPAVMGKVELDEAIHDDGTLDTFLTQPPPLDSSLLTWKPEGLRLFDKYDRYDEEELEEGSFVETNDLESLIRKRKLDLQADEVEFAEGRRDLIKPGGTFQMLDSDISLRLGSLGSFLQVRNGTPGTKQVSASQDPPNNPARRSPVADAGVHQRQERIPHQHVTDNWLLPTLPEVVIPNKRRSFIVSATFLRDRKLVRQIQKLFPTAELIERDWSLHLQAKPTPRSSKQGYSTTAPDSLVDEADVIVSPSTGLILTTLQKIKQQALPGQSTQSTIRERIRRAASRYESLVVLVSAHFQTGEYDEVSSLKGLDHNDCEAILHFTTFCSSLEDEVQSIFIMGRSDELSRWIVAIMIQQGAPDSNLQPIQDETLWELFLRRAGLNAYAAQAILGELHEEKMGKSKGGDFGLTAFVKMSAEERIARFEKMFGGSRLLSKINNVFEARW